MSDDKKTAKCNNCDVEIDKTCFLKIQYGEFTQIEFIHKDHRLNWGSYTKTMCHNCLIAYYTLMEHIFGVTVKKKITLMKKFEYSYKKIQSILKDWMKKAE